MSTLSTHVLDTSLGRPAAGVRITLSRDSRELGSAVTDADGRVKDLLTGGGPVEPGSYTLRFDVGKYFADSGRPSFYSSIDISFKVGTDAHYHVPLLLSPFGYSTYRGS